MRITVAAIFLIIALIFFLLAGIGVSRPPLSWRDLAYASLTIFVIVYLYGYH